MKKVFLVAVSFFFLQACQEQGEERACRSGESNYLLDADFALEGASKGSPHWVALQHAGEKSAEIAIENGVLTIARTESQSWYFFKQKVRSDDFRGATIAFEADIKLDLLPREKGGIPDYGAGLSVAAYNGNGRLLRNSSLEHEPHRGRSDWVPVQVVLELPVFTRVLNVGFMHQANGVLQVRNPSLRLVEGSSENCGARQ